MNSTSHSLHQKIVETTEQALKLGALKPLSTQLQIMPHEGINFCVRVLDSLVRKDVARQSQKPKSSTQAFNPFLPYEKALCVAPLSSTHICLLNKFNVVDHHILMVTREYESQETWLTYADFEVLVHCLIEIDGLGFYNSGQKAGASQHHKHLQLIPFSTEQGSQELPFAKVINAQKEILQNSSALLAIPFCHGVQPLKICWIEDCHREISDSLFKIYQQLMVDIGLNLDAPQPDTPYNLLITREWMMAVPRSQESYQGIGVNSLGYSGMLLVKNLEDLERLRQIGPMNLLQAVGKPLRF